MFLLSVEGFTQSERGHTAIKQKIMLLGSD